MSDNVIPFPARGDADYGRLVDDDVLDVFMAAFWHQSAFAELLDSPNLRQRTREAMIDVREYLNGRDAA